MMFIPNPETETGRSSKRKKRESILFVDDIETLRALGKALLEHLGYEAVVTASGQDALRMYQEKQIDLVITDMCMPEMSGLELCRSLRALDPNTKVILCSGYDMNFEKAVALTAGAYGFLSKPFNIDDLRAMIAHALETE